MSATSQSALLVRRGLALVAVLGLAACPEPPWPDVTPAPVPPEPPPRVAPAPADDTTAGAHGAVALSPEAVAALAPIFEHNDRIHAALAGDRADGVGEAGVAIAEAALAARRLVTDHAALALLADVETRARALGRGGDLEAMRLAYGELSKPLVALASAAPELRGGRHVFMCPMARGYQKWLQVEPSLRNPYFGSKMLTCGEASDWSP
ncbi:MAG: DUF3347 domain-containing protein [Deltaproteobacteria bacterium]|nr:DUF3347 domain-containing protein [Deltaproteobacteria bacterium]